MRFAPSKERKPRLAFIVVWWHDGPAQRCCESSQFDPAVLERLAAESDALPPNALGRLLLYKEFLRAVIVEIKQELRKRVESSFWERVKERVTGGVSSLFESLDTMLEEADEQRFISAIAVRRSTVQTKASDSKEFSAKANASANVGANPSLSAGGEISGKLVRTADHDQTFSDVLLRTFNIKALVGRLKDVLEGLGIPHLYASS